MRKDDYIQELEISETLQVGSRKRSDVMKVQSWLTLFALQNSNSGTATSIDEVFNTMSAPLKMAFEKPLQSTDLRSMIIEAAHNHLEANARELNIKGEGNSGPWVRSYMDRNEGNEFPWCVGFVQSILDQACSVQGKNFTKLVKLTYSCDVLGTTGIVTAVVNEHIIETIEGNTNEGGSREGISVLKRTRNFATRKIDFFSIAPLVS